MKKYLILIATLLFLMSIYLIFSYFYINNSFSKAKKDHYKNWKNEFFFKEYKAVIFFIDTTKNKEYLKMKDISTNEYINEDYIFNFSPTLFKNDSIYKEKNSYNIFLLKQKDSIKLNYKMEYE